MYSQCPCYGSFSPCNTSSAGRGRDAHFSLARSPSPGCCTQASKGCEDEVQDPTSLPTPMFQAGSTTCVLSPCLSLSYFPRLPPTGTGGPWQGGTPPDCELLRGKGCANGIPVTSGAGALQASHHARRINSRRCPLPARCCSGFPTCRRLQRPDVLGPEGAVGLLQALSTGEQGTELLVALSTGMGDKVRPEGCKFRCFP